MANPEYSIDQIRAFVAKGYGSVAAGYVKAALEHYDALVNDGEVISNDVAANDPGNPTFDDNYLMPFGKYKGQKLCNVPAGYLLWLNDQAWSFKDGPLKRYILDNMDILKQEKEVEK